MNKMIPLTTIWILTAGMFCSAMADVPQPAPKLHVALNREVALDESEVRLERISTLTGPKELVERAKKLVLGTFSARGQILYADRNTVLSRLASAGIPAWQVELAGADTSQIRQNEMRIESQQITAAAKAYLQKQLAGQKTSFLQAVATPAAVVLSDPNSRAELTARMGRYQTPGARRVTITVSQEEVPVAQREVVFAVRFMVHRAVAARELSPGMVIRSEDVKIEQVESSIPEPADWKEPYGLAARRRIAQGALIHPDWVGPADAPTLIRRNQQVLVQIDTGALYLSAPGQSLDEGRAGELIRVRRGQRPDERIIYCTVQADGTVRPQI